MIKRSRVTKATKSVSRRSRRDAAIVASTVYSEFSILRGKQSPSWHPVKKMRYVFFRMIGGTTVSDAIREIKWDDCEFWHLVDLKRHGPFRVEYKRAKALQARAFSDSVVTVAEGRDRISRRHKKRMDRVIAKVARKIAKTNSPITRKMLMSQLMTDLREHDKLLIGRNKLQIEAAKWIAKTSAPNEFSESSRVAVGSSLPTDDDPQKPILVQFVGPNGKVVPI